MPNSVIRRMCGFRSHIAPLLCILALAAPKSTSAAQIYWVGYQNGCNPSGPQNASFFHADNWFNFVLPAPGDIAYFGSGFDPGGNSYPTTLYFGDHCVQIGGFCGSVSTLAGSASCSGILVQDGSFVFDLGPGSWLCSPPGGAHGSLTITGGLIIGDLRETDQAQGFASLVLRGGTVTTGQTLVGRGTPGPGLPGTGSGSLTITGANTTLSTQLFDVGVEELGTCDIVAGADVIAAETRIGQQYGANGTVRVSGTGSLLDGGGATIAGWQLTSNDPTRGVLEIENNGRAQFTAVVVAAGNHPEHEGEVHVTGSGASLAASGNLEVGYSAGTGLMTLTSGALGTATGCRLGTLAAGSGTLTMSGSATRLELAASLVIGRFGAGVCTIGTGATVQMLDSLFVASRGSGQGTLTMTSGAQVLGKDGVLGRLPGPAVQVDITGAGTRLAMTRQIQIGLAGRPATVHVGAGASMAASTGTIVGPTGTLLLDGTLEGDLVNHGTLSPGDPVGIGTITGDVVLESDSRLVIDFASTVMAFQGSRRDQITTLTSDRLVVTDSLTLGGILEIRVTGGGDPSPPQELDILTAAVIGGSFDEVIAPQGWTVVVDSAGVQIHVPATDVESNPTVAQSFTLRVLPGRTVEYDVPSAGVLSLEVFDVAGRRIETLWRGPREPGTYRAVAGADAYRAGVYFVRLQGKGTSLAKRLIVH